MSFVPSTGLIRDHYNYGVWSTDAPPIFHVGAMLAAIAPVVADKSMVILEGVPYPLHIWVMLVGQSTRDRKTTSAKLAADRLRTVAAPRIQQVHGSPEGLLQAFVEQPCSLLYVPEGGAFFAQREASYWRHAKEMLMDLFDHQHEFVKRLRQQVTVIREPRVSVLSATARSLLERYTTDVDWLGGFMARFLLLAGQPIRRAQLFRRDLTQEAQLEQQLRTLGNHNWGPMAVGSAAKHVLADFNMEIAALCDNVDYDESIHPCLYRLAALAPRLAGLYEIASRSHSVPKGTTLVRTAAANAAVALCRASIEHAIQPVVGDMTAIDRKVSRAEQLLRAAGPEGMTRSTLIRALGVRAREMDELVKTLDQRDTLVIQIERRPRGRPATRYCHQRPMQPSDTALISGTWVDFTSHTSQSLVGLRHQSQNEDWRDILLGRGSPYVAGEHLDEDGELLPGVESRFEVPATVAEEFDLDDETPVDLDNGVSAPSDGSDGLH